MRFGIGFSQIKVLYFSQVLQIAHKAQHRPQTWLYLWKTNET